MGQATYNLSRFFNRLGIKNPNPVMLESIQPVILAGDHSEIVPQLRPPSAMFGLSISGLAGLVGVMQLVSQGAGGTLIHALTSASVLSMSTRIAELATLFAFPPSVTFGNTPVSSRFLAAAIVNPFGSELATMPASTRPQFQSDNRPMYLARGQVFTWGSTTAATAVNNNTIWITDLPASELD